MKSLLILLTFAFCAHILQLSAFDNQDSTTQEEFRANLSAVYGSGYDGSDLRALQAAWAEFVKTKGLESNEKRIEHYWFKIEVDNTYRIVEIFPKSTMDQSEERVVRTHWLFGTEGKFWVHKATFEVDKKQVIPPDNTDGSPADRFLVHERYNNVPQR